MDPDLVVRPIRDQEVLLLRVMREGEIVNGSAHAKGCAAWAATLGPARRSRGMHEETGNKFSLLRKHLNPVAASLANIDESVVGDVNAVEGGSKLFLVRRRT